MASTFVRRLLHLAPITLALVLVLAEPRPAQAVMCFQDLGSCYFKAALTDSYWSMWFTGLDCELDWVQCTRLALIGR